MRALPRVPVATRVCTDGKGMLDIILYGCVDFAA